MRADTILKASGAAFLLAMVGPAQAVFHLMKIVEIFAGTPAAPNAQYLVLQMYAPGQDLVAGHEVTFFNASGAVVASFVFPGNVGNGASQARILVATPQAATFFGITPDLVMAPSVFAAGGKACFAGTIDCVAWGAYTGSSAGVGTPFNAAGGIVAGRAAVRRLDIAGSAAVLDGADDTNNCAVDFVTGLPAPRNNSGALGTIPASTCGNGALEGLEQCDDGNTSNVDACSSACLVQQPLVRPVGDYDGDGRSDILWRNVSTGANAIWKAANFATSQAVTTVANTSWKVAGRGDFDGDGRADIFWRNTASGGNVIWRGANSATPQAVTAVTTISWRVAGVGDFDADGRADVLWRNDVSGANAVWRSALSSQAQSLTRVADLAWKIVGVTDFDGDQHADILWRRDGTGANAIWRSGLSSQLRPVATVANTAWKVAGTGDFDADGASDILWRNGSTGSDVIWRSANAAQPIAVTAVTNLAWKIAGVGDFNGDVHADILWRNTSTGANALWRSGQSAQVQSLTGVTNQSWTVVP